MIPSGQMAFANARIRALKSQLLTADVRHAAASDIHPTLDVARCYRTVLVSLPSARSLVRTLLECHEIENVKLLWRAIGRGHGAERWSALWRPLNGLASVPLETARECTSLAQVVESLRTTPYGEVASAMWRAHRDDLLAADLGFDQWISRRLLAAAMSLDPQAAVARDLLCSIVGERDLNVLRRGVTTYGLSADAVAGAMVWLPQTMSTERLAALATWTPQQDAFAALWPPRWRHLTAGVADWDALLLQWRRARYRACRRAFLGDPFGLAPAVALLLLVDEETRALSALVHTRRGVAETPSLAFALAASAIGH